MRALRPCGVGATRRRFAARVAAVVLVAGMARPLTPQPLPPDRVTLQWDVRVPMRDGVTLSANVYRPAATVGRVPVVLTITPYTADAYHARAMRFAEAGFAFVVLNVRGRGGSGGRYAPFERDGDDGADAIAWLARQPWSTGRVGMWGGSYAGFAQWAVAARRPPALRTIVPAAAVYPGHDWPFLQGIRFVSSLLWLAETSGPSANVEWGGDDAFWRAKTATLARQRAPFAQFDALAGVSPATSSRFQRWLRAAPGAAFWRRMTPSAAQYAGITIPVLTITGSHDVDQPGALRYYREHRAATRKASPHVLLFGPWDHAGTRTPRASFRGLTYGPASVLDLDAMHREWYDWTLRDGPRPAWAADPVRWFDAPDGAWHPATSLAALATDTLRFVPDGIAATGTLADPVPLVATPNQARSHRLRYDPSDTLRLARDLARDPASAIDTTRLAAWREDGLVLATPPLTAPVRLAGAPRVRVHLRGTVPSADLAVECWVRLPDRRLVRVSADLARVSLRPDRTTVADFATFPVNLVSLPAGSRLLFALTPVDRQLYEPDPWVSRVIPDGSITVELGRDAEWRVDVPVRPDAR